MNQAFSQILQTEYNDGMAKGEAIGVAKGEAKKEAEIQEILDLMLKGKSNTAIAKELNVDEDKVKVYRKYVRPLN